MFKGFYLKLAFDNLRKNRKIYLPFILACVITVAMFYIINSLASNESVLNMSGGETISYMLVLGAAIVGIFAVIFLFYTHGFIIKQRKKEFGLFNILGMEKRHIGIVVGLETLQIALLSLTLGIGFGLVLDKLMYLLIARILNADYGLGFFFSFKAFLTTVILFGCIFAAVYAYAFIRVQIAQPIELLKGGNVGEKEPKTKAAMAVIGGIALISGYVCSIFTQNGLDALLLFFIAVILVIIGTYFLFTAGSIALLKALKRNKKYYYKTNHFTSVSGLTYRMKQNAAGLASICILATMLLVTVSTTSSFMFGRNDMIKERYPYHLSVKYDAAEAEVTQEINCFMQENNTLPTSEVCCTYLAFTARYDGRIFTAAESAYPTSTPYLLVFLTAENYLNLTGESITLDGGEAAVNQFGMTHTGETLEVLGKKFAVKQRVNDFINGALITGGIIYNGLYVIVSDDAELNAVYELQKEKYGKNRSETQTVYAADFDVDESAQQEIFEKLSARLTDGGYGARVFSRAAQADNFMSLYGGLFFLGVYLSALFLMGTILIIYYKQISEGYEDKTRFEIMQKVGMSYAEVKRSVRSQILTVFFLPLVTAGVHTAFAFPMVSKMLSVLGLTNTGIFALCSLGCFGLFALIYVAVYLLTAKVYYRVINGGKR